MDKVLVLLQEDGDGEFCNLCAISLNREKLLEYARGMFTAWNRFPEDLTPDKLVYNENKIGYWWGYDEESNSDKFFSSLFCIEERKLI